MVLTPSRKKKLFGGTGGGAKIRMDLQFSTIFSTTVVHPLWNIVGGGCVFYFFCVIVHVLASVPVLVPVLNLVHKKLVP